ncbi:MAG: RNHCP domain-containing protein [Myxococcota bacterium]
MDLATLLAARSRGEIKRWGAWLDRDGRDLRPRLVAAARARGADVPDDWESLDGKRLLRVCLARAGEAQVRTNPIQRDEAFRCVTCGFDVPKGGRRPRDHCPRCLHSMHVDVVPGDRAAGCGGVLVPVELVVTGPDRLLLYRCDRCGMERRNRVLDDVETPDEAEALAKLLVPRGRAG